MGWRARAAAAALVAILAGFGLFFLMKGGGTSGASQGQATATPTACGLALHDEVVVVQNNKPPMGIPVSALKVPVENFYLAEGTADLTFTVAKDNSPAKGVQTSLVTEKSGTIPQVTDSFGKVTFSGVTTFQENGKERFNLFSFHYGSCKADFALLVGAPSPNGSVSTTGPVNTPDQMGVPVQPGQPHTVNFTVDPKFVAAFARFCGFSPDQATKVGLIPNDVDRFQVAWTGSEFVQANSVIPAGQYIWAVWFGDTRCIINPPCGNPSVPPKVLPPAPPEEELPPPPTTTPGREVPTSTPPASSTPVPSATHTPRPPTVTPVPPTATQTAQPRPTTCGCPPVPPDRPTVIPTPVNTVTYNPPPIPPPTQAPDPGGGTPVTH